MLAFNTYGDSIDCPTGPAAWLQKVLLVLQELVVQDELGAQTNTASWRETSHKTVQCHGHSTVWVATRTVSHLVRQTA